MSNPFEAHTPAMNGLATAVTSRIDRLIVLTMTPVVIACIVILAFAVLPICWAKTVFDHKRIKP